MGDNTDALLSAGELEELTALTNGKCCRGDVCLLSRSDGVLCEEGDCDVIAKMRPKTLAQIQLAAFPALLAAYRAQEAKAKDAERKFQLMLQERERFARDKLAAEAQLADLRAQVERQVEALTKIERWFGEFPPTGKYWENTDGTMSDRPMSYAACCGSNGERDFMRGVARAALPLPPDLGERK